MKPKCSDCLGYGRRLEAPVEHVATLHGMVRRVQLSRSEVCPTCRGRGHLAPVVMRRDKEHRKEYAGERIDSMGKRG